MSTSSRRTYIGDRGESLLKDLAVQGGILCQKVENDRRGWDFLLELPEPSVTIEPNSFIRGFTLAASPSTAGTCFVQVKSTDSRTGVMQVTLSNWEFLVTKLIPSFFIVFEFDGEKDPQRAFVVHIDNSYARKYLERRQKARSMERSDLNRMKMSFKYGADQALSPIAGDSLLQSLLKHFADEGLADYVRRRQELIKTSGYETGAGIVKFSVNADLTEGLSIDEYLADIRLGVRSSLEVTEFSLTHSRFGISDSSPLAVLGPGQLEVENLESQKEKVLVVFGCEGSQDIVLEMAAIVAFESAGFGMRLTAPFVDILVYSKQTRPSSIRVTSPVPESMYPLRDLYSYAQAQRLADWMGCGKRIRIRIFIKSGLRPLEGELHGQSIHKSDPTAASAMLGEIILRAWIISRYFNVQDFAEVSLRDLIIEKGNLEIISRVLNPGAVRVTIRGIYEPPLDPKEESASSVCVPLAYRVRIGDFRFLLGIIALGSLVRSRTGSDELELETLDVKVVEAHISMADEGEVTPANLVNSIASRYHDECKCLILKEFIEGSS